MDACTNIMDGAPEMAYDLSERQAGAAVWLRTPWHARKAAFNVLPAWPDRTVLPPLSKPLGASGHTSVTIDRSGIMKNELWAVQCLQLMRTWKRQFKNTEQVEAGPSFPTGRYMETILISEVSLLSTASSKQVTC
jgi:hypothetical protein